RRLERDERLIERRCTLRHAACTPITTMTGNRIDETMVPQVVAGLIKRAWPSPWLCRMQQRQAQHIVSGLIPTILTIVENGCAECVACVSNIRPLLRRHFVGVRTIVATLDG